MTKAGAVLVAILSGCATNNTPEAWERRIRASAATNPPLLVVPGASVGDISLGMSKAQVREILGAPEMQRSGAWEYLTRGYALGFVDDRLAVVFAGASCPPDSALVDAFKGRTREGLGMGSSRSDIVAALGEPPRDRVEGEAERLSYRDLGIEFSLWRGKVHHVTIRAWPKPMQDRTEPAPTIPDREHAAEPEARVRVSAPECAMRIVRADPGIDPDMSRPAEGNVDPKMVVPSMCSK